VSFRVSFPVRLRDRVGTAEMLEGGGGGGRAGGGVRAVLDEKKMRTPGQ
jgi:hypothetical protein